MTFTIHSYTAADGMELRYGLLTSSHDAVLAPPHRGMVFVPGLGGSVKNSLVFFNALLQHFNPIVVPDLRGFGLNDSHPLPHPKQFVSDLACVGNQVVPQYFSEMPWTLGGISLGGCVVSHWLGGARSKIAPDSAWLLAPAVKEHPDAFQWPYVAKALWTMLIAPSSLVQLPYGLESLTTNPAVLASEQHQQHMTNFRIPARFLWKLRAFNRSAVKAYPSIELPVHLTVPLSDQIICPAAMEASFQKLPSHSLHQCKKYEGLYHDVSLEIGMRGVVDDLAAWCRMLDADKLGSLLNVSASVV